MSRPDQQTVNAHAAQEPRRSGTRWLTAACDRLSTIGAGSSVALALVTATSLLLASGCAGYRLGATNPELTDGKTVQVNFFENRTIEPRLSEALNHALRRSLQQDGSLRLDSGSSSDWVINGVILEYDRKPLSFQPDDVISVQDYEILLRARIRATERRSGKVLLDRVIVGRTSVRVGSDLPSVERQALPMLALDWATKATDRLVEGSW